MVEKQQENIFKKYPALAYFIPVTGGMIAWYITKIIWIGIALLITGLIVNYLQLNQE